MELLFTPQDVLESAVDEIIGLESLQSAFKSGKKLKVKLGIDPTSPNIHLGRAVVLWRLRAFQELGHEIHLIIGDFTGQVGDTSDKDAERPMLSEETVKENLATYEQQMWMILNPEKKDQVFFHRNSEWLEPLTLAKLGALADAFSVNQFIKRELIAKRLESGSRVSLREMLYPLMQGYDSVMLESNVELGGTDQRFNMLAGRVLQEQAGQEPQSVIMGTLLSGTDGRKMSSSWGNVITLFDTPTDKFGKLMAINDSLIAEYLNCLPISARPFTAGEVESRISSGENPRDLKMELAERIVALYHGEETAKEMREEFISRFSEGNRPADIPVMSFADLGFSSDVTEALLVEVLVAAQLAPSKSEARRLIEQGGVRVDDTAVSDLGALIKTNKKTLLQVGKRRFLEIGE
ncbi:MAG: tyrS [Patescibacteria group bacterium]|jgi:tyrosyl-tRNA synthetase|nr:tyrS [Patescibacteria group bacterium]